MPQRKSAEPRHIVDSRTILFGECDPAGILYTPRICEYIVEAALKFLANALGEPFERYVFAQGLNLPARNIDVDFLAPLTYDDVIEIRAGLDDIRTHAYTVRVTAYNAAGKTAFSGTITQVCVDADKKLAPIPEKLRQALEQHALD